MPATKGEIKTVGPFRQACREAHFGCSCLNLVNAAHSFIGTLKLFGS